MFIDIMAKLECYRLVHMNDASISTRKSMCALNREDTSSLPHVRESGIQQFFAVGIRNPEDWSPESTMVWNLESTMVWNLESTMVWIPESRKLESRGRDPESRTFVDSLTWGKALVYKLLCTSSCDKLLCLGLPGSIAHFFLYLCLCLCQTCELAYGQSLLRELHCSFSFKKMLQGYIPKVQCMAV